jgi:biotin carboxylase
VIKPTRLSGSLGVRVVRAPEQFPALMAATLATGTHGLGPIDGVLVEEYVDGPEFSVDCWVLDGEAGVLFSGLILKGYAPSAINIGCIVGRGITSPDVAAALAEAACAAAVKCGVNRTIANVDLRWTAGQARVLEVNGRPGGELLPYLAFLSSGVRVGAALVDVALGRRPPPPPPASRAAGIAFIAPPRPLAFGELRLSEARSRDAAVHELQATGEPGRRVVPPPEDPWGRVGWAIVTGATAEEVRTRMDVVWNDVQVLPHA